MAKKILTPPATEDETTSPSFASSKKAERKHISFFVFCVIGIVTALTIASATYNIQKIKEFTLYNTYMQARTSMVKDFYLLMAVAEMGYMYTPPVNGQRNSSSSSNYWNFIKYNPPKLLNFTYKYNEDTKVFSRLLPLELDQAQEKADAWEEQAYTKLQNAEKKMIYEVNDIQEQPFMRFLAPVPAKEPCISCHIDSRVGDWVGLISVSVSLEEPLAKEESAIQVLLLFYMAVWLVICCLFIWGGQKLKNYISLLRKKDIAVEVAEKASKSKSEFLANMSHEVRTPLNGVLGMAEILSHTSLNTEQHATVLRIQKAGNSLLNVLNDILDFSKIEAGKLTLETETFPLYDVVYDVMQDLASVAHAKNLEFPVRIAPDAPPYVRGDALRLRQVLLNLVNNAIKFTEKGEVGLLVDVLKKDEDIVTVQFRIKDTGIGIPPEKLAKIFSAFEQVDSSTTRKYGGTGLGLSISHKLVELMGGRLQVQSQAGEGSVFAFALSFPWDKDAQQEYFVSSSEMLHDLRVLVLDDNKTNRHILLDQLSHWYMRPVESTHVDEALEILRKAHQDGDEFYFILSDMQMPEKDGIDFGKAVKNDALLRHIPIILLTSGDFPSEEEKVLFARTLRKPVRSTDLFFAMLHIASGIAVDEAKPAYQKTMDVSSISLNILLVEDMEMNQLVAKGMLHKLGHTVTIANHGQDALDILQNSTFDIILMDIQMPVMDGVQAVVHIREKEIREGHGTHVPIVAMTANALKGDKERYLACGMDGYVSKPITFVSLIESLEELIERFELGIKKASALEEVVEVEPVTDVLQSVSTDTSSPSGPSGTFLDMDALQRSFGGDIALTTMSMNIYLRDMPLLVEKIKNAIEAQDAVLLMESAHTLKGLTGYYTKSEVYTYTLELEQMGRSNTLQGFHKELDIIMQQLERTTQALAQEMQTYINTHS